MVTMCWFLKLWNYNCKILGRVHRYYTLILNTESGNNNLILSRRRKYCTLILNKKSGGNHLILGRAHIYYTLILNRESGCEDLILGDIHTYYTLIPKKCHILCFSERNKQMTSLERINWYELSSKHVHWNKKNLFLSSEWRIQFEIPEMLL